MRTGILTVIVAVLIAALLCTPALADQQTITVTGILNHPEVTPYQYGTHNLIDESSGRFYALYSSTVDLNAYVGKRVTVTGSLVPGYGTGLFGPPLIEASSVTAPGTQCPRKDRPPRSAKPHRAHKGCGHHRGDARSGWGAHRHRAKSVRHSHPSPGPPDAPREVCSPVR